MAFRRVKGDPVKRTESALEKIHRKQTRAVRAGSLVFVGVIKEMLSHPGTGKIRRGGRTRLGRGSFNRNKEGRLVMVHRGAARTKIDPTNRASVPGQPPAPDTAELRNSIDFEMTGERNSRVGTGLKKAGALEFGTPRMAPRPFMRPSLPIAKELMGPVVAEELRRSE